jgi:multidrug efflux pump subunit AcrA (membrane-fusion protein)
MTTTHYIGVAGATVVLSISAVGAGCSTRSAAATANTVDPVTVVTASATVTDVAGTIDAGGVVQARTTATIAARILAPIREVRVSPGDRVRRGDTLVVLDGDDLAAGAQAARSAAIAAEQGSKAAGAELQAAEASLGLARASHDRVAGLHARGSATAQELDDATGALRSAEARVTGSAARMAQGTSLVEGARAASQQATTTHTFAALTAPFDGVVTEKLVEPGNLAAPGLPLLRLEDTTQFRLEVRVDESHVGHVRPGDRVPVLLDADRTPMDGTVVEVSRSVDADARAFLVKVALPDTPNLRSGMFGKARFGGPSRRGVTVPPSAIVRRGQVTSVFVVDHGVARVRLVHVSGPEVVAGLSESERVILTPPTDLKDGRRVRVEGGR